MTMSLSSKCLTTGIFLVPGKNIYLAIFLATQEIRGKLLHGATLKLRSPWVFMWTPAWAVSKWQFWRKCCPRTGGQRLSKESRGRFTETIQLKRWGFITFTGLFQGPVANFVLFSQKGSPKLYKPPALQNADTPRVKKKPVGLIQKKPRSFGRRITCTD